MLEAKEKLRNDKMVLEVRLLRRLKELRKAFDDISGLQERVASDSWRSLRPKLIGNALRTMELKRRIQKLKKV